MSSMSAVLTVALLQVEAAGYDQDENLRRGEDACRRAASLGADVALFPEMWNVGYGFEHDREPDVALARWRAQAVARDSSFVAHFAGLAAELGLAIAVTYLEAWPGGPRPMGIYRQKTMCHRPGRHLAGVARRGGVAGRDDDRPPERDQGPSPPRPPRWDQGSNVRRP